MGTDEAVWIFNMNDSGMALLINLLALRVFVDLILCRHFYNERRKVKPMAYVPDNLDMFDRWDAKQQDELDKLPECADCGEPIQDEYAYFINGDWICEDCMDSYRKEVLNNEDFGCL